MSAIGNLTRWAVVVLAVLAVVRPAAPYDPPTAFAKGTTLFGLQGGGGVHNNIEEHGTVSDISFVNFTPRVSHLFFSPFGSGLLRSAFEPGPAGWVSYYLAPKETSA